jgi:hypothetical protein
VFSCIPKDATSLTALSVYNNGMADQNGPLTSNALTYISDCVDLKNIFTVKMLINKELQPGKKAKCVVVTPSFLYNIATADAHNLTYQKNQGGHQFLIRMTGCLGHDTVNTAEQGLLQGGVDALLDVTYTINYDAGKDLHDISVVDNSDTFTNAGAVSSKPSTAQQSFSI